jgi:DNA polymerase-3 subunit epsilon
MDRLLQTLSHPDRWVVLDTETTGRGPEDEIVEIAVVSGGGDLLIDQTLRPTVPVTAAAAKVHGLTLEHLRRSPVFPAIYEELTRIIGRRTVVAYCAAFDRRVLEATCSRYELPPIPGNWLCALELFQSIRGFRAPLHIACEIEGLDVPPRHRAATDAQLTWRLVRQLRVARSVLDN